MPGKNSLTDNLVKWIQSHIDKHGGDSVAVLEITGSRDSSVAAALCVKALGVHRVIGVIMPDLVPAYIEDAVAVCDALSITRYVIPVTLATSCVYHQVMSSKIDVSKQAIIELPFRVRVATLYTVAKSLNGVVVGSVSLARRYVGDYVQWADNACDIAPLGDIKSSEVLKIGKELGLSGKFLNKGGRKSFGQKYGFSEQEVEGFLDTHRCDTESKVKIKKAIDSNSDFLFTFPASFHPEYCDFDEEVRNESDMTSSG